MQAEARSNLNELLFLPQMTSLSGNAHVRVELQKRMCACASAGTYLVLLAIAVSLQGAQANYKPACQDGKGWGWWRKMSQALVVRRRRVRGVVEGRPPSGSRAGRSAAPVGESQASGKGAFPREALPVCHGVPAQPLLPL